MLNELNIETTPVILNEDDLNSMNYSIENRSPYLDKEIFIKYARSKENETSQRVLPSLSVGGEGPQRGSPEISHVTSRSEASSSGSLTEPQATKSAPFAICSRGKGALMLAVGGSLVGSRTVELVTVFSVHAIQTSNGNTIRFTGSLANTIVAQCSYWDATSAD